MAQLIKLQDYVSRYEQNIFLYPSRLVRLKKQQWDKLMGMWENGEDLFQKESEQFQRQEEKKQPIFHKIKGLFQFGTNDNDIEEIDEADELGNNEPDGFSFPFSAVIPVRPPSIDELKQQFLDQFFQFQMKWASSTITEKSFVNPRFLADERLKFFLQRFPDTFLVLYQPVFLLKQAPIEAETILLGPTGAWCVNFLEEEDLAVFTGSRERFWVKRNHNNEKKVLNPLLALNRTEKIIKKLFHLYEIAIPVHKVVVCRNGYIDYPAPQHDVEFVEKRNFQEWFDAMRAARTPLKHMQLKGAQALLQYCQTMCIRRLEWTGADEEADTGE